MEAVTKQSKQDSLQPQLAVKFRQERLRLGFSTTDVAYFCGVSVSSVFGWEAGRSKIPAIALALLWERGFDPEVVVGGTSEPQEIRVVSESEDIENSKFTFQVPMHILLRYQISPANCFTYVNPAFANGFAAAGDLLLMGQLDNKQVRELAYEADILFRPKDSRFNEFICNVRPVGKKRCHLMIGKTADALALDILLGNSHAVGRYCYKAGVWKQCNGNTKSHEQRLASFLKHLTAQSLTK